jgi:hypothetical protein
LKNKKREYEKHETNSKNRNIRDFHKCINELKKGYHRRPNLVKDENGDLQAESHNISNGWKNFFSELLNVHQVNDVR